MPIPLIVPIALAAGSAIAAGISSSMDDYNKIRKRKTLWDSGSASAGYMPGVQGANKSTFIEESFEENKNKKNVIIASQLLGVGASLTSSFAGPPNGGEATDITNRGGAATEASKISSAISSSGEQLSNMNKSSFGTSSIGEQSIKPSNSYTGRTIKNPESTFDRKFLTNPSTTTSSFSDVRPFSHKQAPALSTPASLYGISGKQQEFYNKSTKPKSIFDNTKYAWQRAIDTDILNNDPFDGYK